MCTYILNNYIITVSEKLNRKRCADILGVILTLAVLCVSAKVQAPKLPTKEAVPEEWMEPVNIAGEAEMILGINAEHELYKIPKILPETGARPEFPALDITAVSPAVPNTEVQKKARGMADPKPFAEDQTASAEILQEPDIVPGPSTEAPEIPEEPTEKETEPIQEFYCGGFICDSNGMIIGCADDIIITDGVLRLPSDSQCTGLRAGVIPQLGAQVQEIYIPANIISIEAGAFDGLDPYLYIQVHQDNPVYGSNEGCLYNK